MNKNRNLKLPIITALLSIGIINAGSGVNSNALSISSLKSAGTQVSRGFRNMASKFINNKSFSTLGGNTSTTNKVKITSTKSNNIISSTNKNLNDDIVYADLKLSKPSSNKIIGIENKVEYTTINPNPSSQTKYELVGKVYTTGENIYQDPKTGIEYIIRRNN